jgi:hypothetical protein
MQQNSQSHVGRPARVYRFRKIKAALMGVLARVRMRIHEHCFGGVQGAKVIADEPRAEWFAGLPDAELKAAVVAKLDRERLAADALAARARAQARYEKLAAERQAMLSLDALLTATSTPLPDDRTYENARQYRDNLYLGKVRAAGIDGRQISRADAAKELGVSADTISAMTKRAGVERVAQYRGYELKPGLPIIDQVRALASWALNYGGAAIVAVDPGGDVADPVAGIDLNRANLDIWAMAQWQAGRRVYLRVQVASKEVETTPEPPPASTKPSNPANTPAPTRRERAATIWRGFNPVYVERQLALRGLVLHVQSLVDRDTGEVLDIAP